MILLKTKKKEKRTLKNFHFKINSLDLKQHLARNEILITKKKKKKKGARHIFYIINKNTYNTIDTVTSRGKLMKSS